MLIFPTRKYVLSTVILYTLFSSSACCGIRFPFAQTQGAKEDSRSRSDSSSRAQDESGTRRTDLARFYGVYGDPDEEYEVRQNFFVYKTCDGRLQFGGMWGDVRTWVMNSISDTVFESPNQAGLRKGTRLEFQVGWDGKAKAIKHNMAWRKSPLVRLEDLPDHITQRECDK